MIDMLDWDKPIWCFSVFKLYLNFNISSLIFVDLQDSSYISSFAITRFQWIGAWFWIHTDLDNELLSVFLYCDENPILVK